MDVRASPILLCSLCCANTIGTAIRSLLIGEAQRIQKNLRKLLIGAANSPRFAFWRSLGAPLRLLAQGRYVACSALLICSELAYKFGSTDQGKRKYGKNKIKVNQNKQILSSATI
jgi:hypothetical protein